MSAQKVRAKLSRILVTNWVHEPVLERLAALGSVEANRARLPWPRDEVLSKARDADAT